jgi:hypothetical protein
VSNPSSGPRLPRLSHQRQETAEQLPGGKLLFAVRMAAEGFETQRSLVSVPDQCAEQAEVVNDTLLHRQPLAAAGPRGTVRIAQAHVTDPRLAQHGVAVGKRLPQGPRLPEKDSGGCYYSAGNFEEALFVATHVNRRNGCH